MVSVIERDHFQPLSSGFINTAQKVRTIKWQSTGYNRVVIYGYCSFHIDSDRDSFGHRWWWIAAMDGINFLDLADPSDLNSNAAL